MRLDELFTSDVELKVTTSKHGERLYKFVTPNDQQGELAINKTRLHEEMDDVLSMWAFRYFQKALANGGSNYEDIPRNVLSEFEFEYADIIKQTDHFYSVVFDMDGNFGISGNGEQVYIFSAVMKGINNFINDEYPDFMHLEAAEPSRQKLYSRMAKRLQHYTYFHKDTNFYLISNSVFDRVKQKTQEHIKKLSNNNENV